MHPLTQVTTRNGPRSMHRADPTLGTEEVAQGFQGVPRRPAFARVITAVSLPLVNAGIKETGAADKDSKAWHSTMMMM